MHKRSSQFKKQNCRSANQILTMVQKYMIAVSAPEKTGKSTTVKEVWEMLPGKKDNKAPGTRYERFGIINTPDGLNIGIASRGDNSSEIRDWVGQLIDSGICDVIVCACHSDDSTYQTVINLADKGNYKLIFCSHFYEYRSEPIALSKLSKGTPHKVTVGGVNLNEYTAESIIGLINRLK